MLDRLSDSFIPDDDRSASLLSEVCRLIEAVHGVQGVATYYFGIEELPPGKNGEHTQAFEVLVSSSSKHQVLAGVHEIGHTLDSSFLNYVQAGGSPKIPPYAYASDIAQDLATRPAQGSSLLCGWLRAVRNSNYHRDLSLAMAEENASLAQKVEISKLIKVRELWARSYELFICRRHPKSRIAEQMSVECGESAQIGKVLAFNYWQGHDFDEADLEIENVFRRLGWLIH
jgi:hypothetical protein